MVNSLELYSRLHEYTYSIVNDKQAALKLTDLFVKADLPLQTFVTAAKLYLIILNKASLKAYDPSLSGCSTRNRNYVSKYIRSDKSRVLVQDPYSTFVCCCLISSKYYRDIAYNNESWSNVSRIDKSHINEIERITLETLDYKINSVGDNIILQEIRKQIKDDESFTFQNTSDEGFLKYFKKLLCFD